MSFKALIRFLAYLGGFAILVHLFPLLMILGYMLGSESSEVLEDYEMLRAFQPRAPQWFPDGRRIAFSHAGAIYVVDSEGRDLQKVDGGGDDLIGLAYAPSISPDGSRIAYSAYQRSGWFPGTRSESWEIVTADPDGSGKLRLTETENFETEPVWSPDGTSIAFVAQRKPLEVRKSYERYMHLLPLVTLTLVLDGSDGRMVETSRFFQRLNNQVLTPIWSPDWRYIAYLVPEWRLLIVRVEDRMRFELGMTTGQPGWSPEGRRIAVSRNRVDDGNLEYGYTVDIYTVEPDGPQLSETFPLSIGEAPLGASMSWSPDGSEILFGTMVIALDGSSTRELPGPGNHTAWSPDGSRIAIYARDHTGVVLYTVARDGSDSRTLVTKNGDESLISAYGRPSR